MRNTFTAMMLCVILLFAASSQTSLAKADGIRERTNAPDTLARTFSSHTGKTQIHIDASVEVPNVSRVNVYEVTAREIPAEKITAFADYIIGAGAWTGDTTYRPPEAKSYFGDSSGIFDGVTQEEMSIVSAEEIQKGAPTYMIDAYAQRQAGVYRGSQSMDLTTFLDSRFRYNYDAAHDKHGMDAQGCKYSYAEALSLATEAASILAPELTVAAGGVLFDDEGREAYLFAFTRSVDGISVTYTNRDCTYLDEDENGVPIVYRMIYPYESLKLVVDNPGIVSGRYESPYVLTDPLETDVELLSFDQILEIAENILPLTFAWLEDHYQIEVDIDRITFGYTRVDFKDDMYRYKLVPAWDFFGTNCDFEDGEPVLSDTRDYTSLLTINAIDGTVIDRRFGF